MTGTITLDTPIPFYDPIRVEGPGADRLKIDGDDGPVFTQTRALGLPATITGLTLEGEARGAGADGGAIVLGGADQGYQMSLTIEDCVFSNSIAADDGGAIFADGGELTISGTTFEGNEAKGDGGAIFMELGSSPGTLKITDSRFTRNTSGKDGGAIDVASIDGPTTIERTTIADNTAAANGGGIRFGTGSDLTVRASTLSGNKATGSGGGMSVSASGPFVLENSTISGNTASTTGGGIASLNFYDQPVTFSNSTIAGNSGAVGGGVYRDGYDLPGIKGPDPDVLRMSSTIVAGNSAGTAPDLAQGPKASGSFDLGFSLIGTTAGGAVVTEAPAGSNLLNAGDPELAALADNGGPTQTRLPGPASPALDAGIANGLAGDQRGVQRTIDLPIANPTGGDGTDIGATESGDGTLDGGRVNALRRQKQGKKVSISVRVGAAEDVTATASGVVKIGKRKALALPGVGTEVAAGETTTLKLKPKGKAKRKITKALARRKKPKAALKVVLADAAGNSIESTPVVTLKR